MKKVVLFVSLAICLSAAPAVAATRGGSRPFGLGLVLGEPTGLTAKLYLQQSFALQMGVGWVDDFNDDNGLHLNLDFLWHPVVLAREASFTLPFYLGVGMRFLDHDYRYYYARGVYYGYHDSRLGVRAPFGLLMDFTRVPLDLYLEVALVVDVLFFNEDYYEPYRYGRDRVNWNAGIGVRYYF